MGEVGCICINPIALRAAKTLWSFGHSECNMVKQALCFKQADFDYLLDACLIQAVLSTYSEKNYHSMNGSKDSGIVWFTVVFPTLGFFLLTQSNIHFYTTD